MAESKHLARDHYADVTAKIIAAIEDGTPPWRKPWDPNKVPGGGPVNAISAHRYRGINPLLLGMSAPAVSHDDPRWLSFKQATDKGWNVRKCEKATTVYFFKKVELKAERADAGEEAKTVPVLRSFSMFHASQVDGIPEFVPLSPVEMPWRTPQSASVIVARSGATVREGGEKAFYAPSGDFVQMPPRIAFHSPEGWASTMLHELGHWSGHPSRLKRNLQGRFGSQAYAMEELRAEIASAFIGSELGIPGEIEQHASYVSSWLDVLKKDKREIFRASADAQRIADYLLGFHPLYAAELAKEKSVDTTVHAAGPEAVRAPVGPMPEHVRHSLGVVRQPDVPVPAMANTDDVAPSFRPR